MQADREGAAEADRSEDDVADGDIGLQISIASGTIQDSGDHGVPTALHVGPVVVVEQRIDDVCDADPRGSIAGSVRTLTTVTRSTRYQKHNLCPSARRQGVVCGGG